MLSKQTEQIDKCITEAVTEIATLLCHFLGFSAFRGGLSGVATEGMGATAPPHFFAKTVLEISLKSMRK